MIKVPMWLRDYLKHDGSRTLSADWDIGNGRMIQADKIRARDGDGLSLFEDGGAGIFVKDGGDVGIGTVAPTCKLHVKGTSGSTVVVAVIPNEWDSEGDYGELRLGSGTGHYIRGEYGVGMTFSDANKFQFLGSKVGIGTSAPGNPLAVNRSADGIIVDFESADTVEGNVSIADNTTSYNAFMGSHYTQLKDGQKTPPVGAIVIATGEIIPCEVNIEVPDEVEKGKEKSGMTIITKDVSGVERKEYFSYVELASQKADKRVYGVYHAKLSVDAKGQSFGEDNKAIYQIAALGLYKMRVTDTNGDIAAGNYIQSSIRQGEGEKQDDDVLHNYTVGKAIINVNFSEIEMDLELGYKWQLIPVTLHCG